MGPELKVLIIGAGIAGLSLAQILRKAGIAFEIFERDNGHRSQGWCISLGQCLDRLDSLLPADLASIYDASATL
ncbi:hypothetical protein FE257_010477 [Aspergillus nanangensis]|uniref:FAD-binding domain-containing protein n=1 Tax=Aspergillus nanangensis TaxID=2582783 RepID=A0AAD4CK38_ASPNN|nr:hypothetical protein FE257_010477 [Aspergillus nanangensis]